MADSSPPKKKSRFFSRGKSKLCSITSSSKARNQSNRPRTPPQQIAPASSFPAAPRHLDRSTNGPSLIPQDSDDPRQTISAPAASGLLANLVSPTTSTANAFKTLSVDDHRPNGGDGAQGLPQQGQFYGGSQDGRITQHHVQSAHPAQAGFTAPQQTFTFRAQLPPPPPPLLVREGGQRMFTYQPDPAPKLPPVVPSSLPDLPRPVIHSYLPARPAHALNHATVEGQSQTHLSTPAPARLQVDQTDDFDRLPDVPDLPPPGYRPGQEPVPNHPGTQLANTPFYDVNGHQLPGTELYYTSPRRDLYQLSSKYRAAVSRKRKRGDGHLLPPPAYIYTRTNDPNFNIFDGFLLYPELCYHFAMHLPVHDLVSLYAISKDYHTILDTRFTTLIVSLAQHLAPNAARNFPFRCYGHLCRQDPAGRIPHPDPRLAAKGAIRKIPSFKYLKMCVHREKVVQEIMGIAAERGVPFPRRCKQSLMKIWFILDIPDNQRRIGYVHNPHLVDDLDLYFGVCAVVKMDMLFNDPVGTEKRDGARRLLLSQRSLTPWLLVLQREIWQTKLDLMKEWVKWKYEPSEQDIEECADTGIFGVPLHSCGMLKHEWWGQRPEERKYDPEGKVVWLLRPDQLIIREGIRRGFQFKKHILRCMLYGYVDPRNLQDLDWTAEGRADDVGRREKVLDEQGDYNFDDLVGGGRSLAVEDGGDRLLDLGRKTQTSRSSAKDGACEQEARWRNGEREFMMRCYNWWVEEMTKMGRSVEDMEGWNAD